MYPASESLLERDPSELVCIRPSGVLDASVVYECDLERAAVGQAYELGEERRDGGILFRLQRDGFVDDLASGDL